MKPLLRKCLSRGLSALLVTTLTCLSAPASGDDWAAQLGYPPGKKVIIVHAHDMGMCYESNRSVAEFQQAGEKVSASAMPPCAWFLHAAQYANSHPESDVGLQLTLNSEWSDYRWRPLSSATSSGSLVDNRGFFWRSVVQTAVNATAEDVEQELEAQLLLAERAGMKPTHLTTHLGALYSRPDLAEVYLQFAQRNWIPAVVVEITPELLERLAASGFPVPENLAQAIENYPMPKLKDLRIVPRTESFEEKVQATLEQIDALPEGLSQLALAPAVESDALKALTPSWRQYVWDHQLLTNDAVRKRLAADDIVLTNWVEVMQRFSPAPQ
ncbi:MAG: polysaccharide deacetylase family protein [Planctomycetales bacterium]|nr:polysaccharide deacetylase family protein [Planctomycetales bacterium]